MAANYIATILLALAILHTFLSSRFNRFARRFREGSVLENLFHLLGEVEVVFGLWAGLLILLLGFTSGFHVSVEYLEGLNFTEPLFVFAIMTIAATQPVIDFAELVIQGAARILPIPNEAAMYISCLTLGPLLGSFITEPAAMTVTAILLRDRYFRDDVSPSFKYATLAILFVNVSIGGVLTNYAAPPVLMVAGAWGWTTPFMLRTFGYKSALAILLNSVAIAMLFRRELGRLGRASEVAKERSPLWLIVLHLAFLSLVVMTSHHAVVFMGLLLFFLGVTTVTRELQSELQIRGSLLVAFFLAGLVVLGGLQSWWLTPLIRSLNDVALFLGATALTAVTDNAALTYLGSQVEGVSDAFRYALMAGAVAGGGLTVIANAPNPAGFSILQHRFGPDGVNPLKLLLFALPPTLVAMAALWFLP